MNVHNIMEETVSERVKQMYVQVQKTKPRWFTCSCEQCQLDTITYVLNRVPPRYVVSGRGMTHNFSMDNKQLIADIDLLIYEGMRAVSTVQRPYHDNAPAVQEENYPAFNFPTIFSSVFDGVSFVPLYGADVTLLLDGKPVEMVDYTWQNPVATNEKSKGVFSFWPKPVQAEKAGENKVFHFTLKVECPEYDSVSCNVDIPLVSEEKPRTSINTTYSLKVQDLFLFPNTYEDPNDEA